MNLLLSINLITLLLFIHFFNPSSARDGKYSACSQRIQLCGHLSDISYPFYDEETRPAYCGHPGFKLDCHHDLPQISISSLDYFLLTIGETTATVARADTWSFPSCPSNLVNATIDPSLFEFTSSDQNITFFYDCKDVVSMLGIHCRIDEQLIMGYYMTSKMLEGSGFDLWEICKGSLSFPILKSLEGIIDIGINEPVPMIMNTVFQQGFQLGMIAELGQCNECVESGGQCGYHSSSNKFVCYCTDDNYDTKCGVNSYRGSKKGTVIGVSIGLVALLLLLLGGGCLFVRRKQKQRVEQEKSRGIFPTPVSSNDGGPHASTPGSNGLTSSHAYTTNPSTCSHSNASDTSRSENGKSYNFGVHVFDYTELEIATNNFDESKELGDGGFGTVYYGVLRDGRCVAVKRLYENSVKRKEQFKNEIKILATLEHKNLVRLYGCTSSSSRDLLLVYEFIANGTVAEHLHGKFSESTFLRWPTRLNIAIETAEALAFLHRNKVIHRDVKTTNILLDDGFHVKVADFGLSREFSMDKTHVSTAPQGTPGYVDPEYYQCYRLTEKSDVYSFGVVLIELISSKLAVDISRHRHDVNLATMAVDRIQNQALQELVDPRLEFDKDPVVQAMVRMVAELGFQCLQPEREMRPTMDEVVARLRAVQLEGVKEQKQEVLDIIVYGDEVGLLTNPTPPLSPELPRSNDVV